MNGRTTFLALSLALASLHAQQTLPLEPSHNVGQSITGAFEGWFPNKDGSFSLLLGYFNRNLREEMDIPIGPNNHIDPSGPDYGQPTHFLPGRMWGEFVIKVPKDFGDKKLTWTITANGKTTTIPMYLMTDWEVAPFLDGAGDTPPYLSFSESGPFINGPLGQSMSATATVGSPLTLKLWVADDASVVAGANRPRTPPATIFWSKMRGAGKVTFAKDRPAVEPADFKAPVDQFKGTATTTATFSDPGEYTLRVVANDWTRDGGGGFQCCWTNATVKVTVKGSSTGGR
ncbi:MAG: hypothetical protein LAO79_11280 [Acidobacteriia bacterium]|nr:hypothetical protein [Terriglobia bacterium]